MDGLAIGLGLAQGIEKATANLQNLQLAKYKLQEDKKMSDLDFKIKNLELQKLESDPKASPELLNMEKDIIKKKYATINSIYDLKSSMQSAAEKGEKDKLATMQTQMNMYQQTLNMLDRGTNLDWNPKKDIEEKILTRTATEEEKAAYQELMNLGRWGSSSNLFDDLNNNTDIQPNSKEDIDNLIEEYNSTQDPNRVKEIEGILTSKGVQFQ